MRVFGTSLDIMLPARIEESRGITTRAGGMFRRISRIQGLRPQWQKLVHLATPPYEGVWVDYGPEENHRIDAAYMRMRDFIVITTPGPVLPREYSQLRIVLNEPFVEWVWPHAEDRKEVRRVWVKDNLEWDSAEPWTALTRHATPETFSSSSTRASP